VRNTVEKVFRPTPAGVERLDEISRRAPSRGAVLEAVIADAPVSAVALRHRFKDAAGHLRRLQADGLVAVDICEARVDPFVSGVRRDTPPTLNAQQQQAVDAIGGAIDAGIWAGFLLHGITGSGKTEVYLHAVERARQAGRGALVLVPEITLTPQLVGRYRARFGDDLAVLHSGMSEKERHDQWRMLHGGRVHVAIGVRSAVFAPVASPGLIVVDEEHDGSFKQEKGFPYHARDMALLRASMSAAVAVLGSATPSLESHFNAVRGRLRLLSLTERATSGRLPDVELVNLAVHRGGPGFQSIISAPLHDQIRAALDRKEQIILFLNRRGFAPNLLCRSCGEAVRCESCAVSMTLHHKPPSITCHYCGARRVPPEHCPHCGAADLADIGFGTQKAEEIVSSLYPDARVARLDRDVANARNAEAILDRLRSRDIDILIGTQMVTKGHDFPEVTLVGVLRSDVGLHMPDFRAAERTFQLLTQVAGRAGRAERKGSAVVQTFSPHHPAVAAAQHHDYAAFAQTELEARRELGYPPFGRLAMVRISGPDAAKVESAARTLMGRLRDARDNAGQPSVSLLGPAPSPLSRLQGRWRWQILLKSPGHGPLRAVLEGVLGDIESPPSGVRIRLDIDPVSML